MVRSGLADAAMQQSTLSPELVRVVTSRSTGLLLPLRDGPVRPLLMLYKTLSAAVYGIDANLIEVEVDVAPVKVREGRLHHRRSA